MVKNHLPDRYRHINQFFDFIEVKGGEWKDAKETISRKEAFHRILGIMKKLSFSWQRKVRPLKGWRNSL